MVINISEILYKYRSFNGRSISMLANNQLYFASPLEFNDPFDCLAQEHIFENFSTEEARKLFLSEGVSSDIITQEQIRYAINEIKKNQTLSIMCDEQEKYLSSLLKKIGVLSFTKCSDSILMWSHYADYHKGFCLGFKNNLGLDKSSIKPVTYVKHRTNDLLYLYASIRHMNDEESNEKMKNEFIFTKYIDWQYEEEWRAVSSKGICLYPDDCLDRVIFGAKMPQENRNVILSILKNKDISFFEAIKSKNSFAIEIKQLLL